MGFLNAFGLLGRFLVAAAVACGAFGVMATGSARMAFLVIALTLGITGATFAFVGTRLGRVSGMDDTLRATGVAGMATVRSIRSIGVMVNGAPVLELELDVDVVSHAPYTTTIRQRVPQFWGPLAPGTTVGVVVDPVDPEHLAIDWDATVAGPPGEPRLEAESVEPDTDRVRDAERLLRTGRRARAVIISMTDARDMSELGLVEVGQPGEDDRLFIVDMEVQEAGLDPYEVRVAHRVPERLVGRVGPRTKVAVAIDRVDETAVAIDWTSVGG